jgi:hypothetical protein
MIAVGGGGNGLADGAGAAAAVAGGVISAAAGGANSFLSAIRNAVVETRNNLKPFGIEIGLGADADNVVVVGAPRDVDLSASNITPVGGAAALVVDDVIGLSQNLYYKVGDGAWEQVIPAQAIGDGGVAALVTPNASWGLALGAAGADATGAIRLERLNSIKAQVLKIYKAVLERYDSTVVKPALEAAGLNAAAASISKSSTDSDKALSLAITLKDQASYATAAEKVATLLKTWSGYWYKGVAFPTDAATIAAVNAGVHVNVNSAADAAALTGFGWGAAANAGVNVVVAATPAGTAAVAGDPADVIRNTVYGTITDANAQLKDYGIKFFAGDSEYTDKNKIGIRVNAGVRADNVAIVTPVYAVFPSGEKVRIIDENTILFPAAALAAADIPQATNRINSVTGACVSALARLHSAVIERIPGRTYEVKISDALLSKEGNINVTTADGLTDVYELKATTIENANSKTFFYGQGALGVQVTSGSLFGALDLITTYSSTKIPITEHTVDGVAVVSKSKVQPLSNGGSLVYGEEVSSNTIGTVEVKERYSYGCEGKVGFLVGDRAAIFVGGGVTRINNEFKHTPDSTNYEGAIKYIRESTGANPSENATAVDVSVVNASEASKKEFSENKSKFVGHFCAGVRVFVDHNSKFFVEFKATKFLNNTINFETPAYKGLAHDHLASGGNHEVKTSSAFAFGASAGISLGG